jgi:phage terminase large subunit
VQNIPNGVVNYTIPHLYAKQILFFKSVTKFTLYGGARGGGKSFVVRHKAITLALHYPGINILILRRTFPELEQNHLKEFKTLLNGIAKYNSQRREFNFPNGSLLKFGYCNTEADMDQYQGQNYEVIFMDEATHFTEYMFMKFKECLRLSGNVDVNKFPNLKPRMYLTANPGGVGHVWVKRLFIDKQYKNGENPEDYSFIPALVYENQFLMENDPEYIRTLETLPEKEKQAMLYGDWSVFQGQFFEEFDEAIHTYNPYQTDENGEYVYKIKPNWRIYRTRDYGLDKLACYWAALDEDGTFYIYREIWESDLIVSESAKRINAMTQPNETIYLDICPPDMWNRNRDTGKSAVDILIQDYNQYPTKANNDREMGWLMVKEMLKISNVTHKPRLLISTSCPHLIESLKMIQHDEKKVNDCAKEPHEVTHSCDAIRYLCTSYTYTPDRIVMAKQQMPSDYSRFALEMGEYEKKEENPGELDFGDVFDEWGFVM